MHAITNDNWNFFWNSKLCWFHFIFDKNFEWTNNWVLWRASQKYIHPIHTSIRTHPQMYAFIPIPKIKNKYKMQKLKSDSWRIFFISNLMWNSFENYIGYWISAQKIPKLFVLDMRNLWFCCCFFFLASNLN